MRKVAHIMRGTKRTSTPKYVIFYDTETKYKQVNETTKHLSLKLGYAKLTRYYEGRGYIEQDACEFTDRRTFLEWISKVCVGKERFYITAHNIGFDIQVTGLMKYLATHGWERKAIVVEGINFIARFRKGSTTIQLVNNQQLFNTSLKKLGESIGIAKLDVDFETVGDADLMTYCKRDVNVMVKAWDLWIAFIRDNDLGGFKMTAASQALGAYKHRFLSHDIYVHTDARAVALERESYHGGRVECFFIGEYQQGTVHYLDVNSMYPFIMKEHAVPTKLARYYHKIPRKEFESVRQRYGYIVEVLLDVTEPVVPVVRDGRLTFPVGRFSCVLTRPEYEVAIRKGTVLDVRRCALYDERPAFSEFVDFFYHARLKFKEEGNTEFAYLSKLFLNSLYGKFGQKQDIYKVIGKSVNTPDGFYKSYDLGKQSWTKYRIIDGIVERSQGFEEGFDSFVAVASYITAAARVLLWSYIEKAGIENVLYCDTDSLFVNEEGYVRLTDELDASMLGRLKEEGKSKHVTIHAPKWYEFGDTHKCKGIRPTARLIGENTYVQEKFVSFAGGVRNGHTDGVIVEEVTKHLSGQYRKGTVTDSGRVLPFQLAE